MSKIADVIGREILDSRGLPTVACEVVLNDGSRGTSSAPSGTSTDKNANAELRDNDFSRFNGKGVIKAVNNINTLIKQTLTGQEANDTSYIDKLLIELDGTPNKSRLGCNSTIAVSFAAAKASANSQKLPFHRYISSLFGTASEKAVIPIPFFNILSGGKHAVGSTDFQEFMVVPVNFKTFRESCRAGAEIYFALGKILEDRSYQPLVSHEGGFAPSLFSNEQAMELLVMAVKSANYHVGEDVFIALDCAASNIYSDGTYHLHRDNQSLTSRKLVDYYFSWTEKYPIISIEDGLAPDDFDGWCDLTQRLGKSVEIIGDDLYVTNPTILQKGIDAHASTGILVKPDQIGTLTETLSLVQKAQSAGFRVIISHRTGETEDDAIADLAVGCGCGTFKAGAPCRSERTAKYNRILAIEEAEGTNAAYASWGAFGNYA